jgi:spectrin alpha
VTREKVSNVDFRLSEIEAQLTSEEYGKDLTSVQNLLKKHALLEADIGSHQDRIDGVKIAAEQFCQVSVA